MKTVVVIRLGNLRGALDRVSVREIAPVAELSISPSLPASIEGVLNLAGKAVLVVDLARLMGIAPNTDADPLYRHIIILAGNHDGLALMVDRAEDVLRIDETAVVLPVSESSFNGCVTGHINLGEAALHLLNADRIFLAAERERLDALRLMEQERLKSMAST